MVKISNEKVIQIDALHKQGISYREIAELIGVNRSTTLRYINSATRSKHNEHSRKDYYSHKEERLKQQRAYSQEHKAQRKYYAIHYYQTWLGFSKMVFFSLKREHGILPYSLSEFRTWLGTQPKKCYLCGDMLSLGHRMVSIDHIVPITQNGPPELSNLRLCCWRCNQIKNAYTIHEVFSTINKWRENGYA